MDNVVSPQNLTVLAAVLIALGAVMSGKWYPSGTVDRLLKEKDERITLLEKQLSIYRADNETLTAGLMRALQSNRRAIETIEKTIH